MVLMYKPSVIDAPFGGAPEKAPRWDLTGTEGCGDGIRFHSVWTRFDILFLRSTEIGKNTTIWVGPPVNRLVPKIIQKCINKPIKHPKQSI